MSANYEQLLNALRNLAAFSTPHAFDFSPFAIHRTFRARSRIQVRISSRDFPFFLPNLSQRTIKIYRDSAHPPSLALPVREPVRRKPRPRFPHCPEIAGCPLRDGSADSAYGHAAGEATSTL